MINLILSIIFYSFGIFAILYEVLVLTEVKTYIRMQNFDHSYSNVFLFCNLLYMFWAFVGLFTSQGPLFVIFWIISIILPVINYITKKSHPLLIKIDSVISILLISFILLNASIFHLKLK